VPRSGRRLAVPRRRLAWPASGNPRTDLLFIDTRHVYRQLCDELARHGSKARKYMCWHDTTTFGDAGEDGSRPGLWHAVEEWVAEAHGSAAAPRELQRADGAGAAIAIRPFCGKDSRVRIGINSLS